MRNTLYVYTVLNDHPNSYGMRDFTLYFKDICIDAVTTATLTGHTNGELIFYLGEGPGYIQYTDISFTD